MKITPPFIIELRPWEVFVFGSNLAGRHGAGAAWMAATKFGAQLGVGSGLTGQCYALPTKDSELKTLSIPIIDTFVVGLSLIVRLNPEKLFLITAVGCGLAGYKPEDIAPLFKPFLDFSNVSLPTEFLAVLQPSTI
jgi:hypothetical protein